MSEPSGKVHETFGFLCDGSDIGDARVCRAELLEGGVDRFREEPREGRLAASEPGSAARGQYGGTSRALTYDLPWRAPQDEAADGACAHEAHQERIMAGEMRLADEFGQALGAQTLRERGGGGELVWFCSFRGASVGDGRARCGAFLGGK